MTGFDWPGLMRQGIGRLGLHPEAFWRLTPAELWLMLGLGPATRPMTRVHLEALARRYPDTNAGDADDGRDDGLHRRDRGA